MSAFDNKKFDAILRVAKRAVTDNERFAAMLIISKSISPSTIPEEKLHEVLVSIGLQFPCRLLSTACKQTEDQETRESYAAIAASVIKLFCIYHHHSMVDVKSVVPLLLKGTETFCKYASSKDMVDDCMEALISLLDQKLDIDYPTVFKTIVSSECTLHGKLLDVLWLVLQNDPEIIETDPFKDWLNNLCTEFKTEKEGRKFEICKILCSLFQKLHEPPHQNKWLSDVMVGLGSILCSKVTQEQQHDGITLAAELLSLYGLSTFINKSCENNFIVVVTRLSCIESGLLFQDEMNRGSEFCVNPENLSFVLSCFKIIEIFCAAVANFEQNEGGTVADVLNFDQIRLAQPTLSEIASLIKKYISRTLAVHEELRKEEIQLFHSCIRVFGCWMNVEYNLSTSQGSEALLIVPSVLRYAQSIKDFQLIKFILPAVMLSTDSQGLNSSMVQDIFSVLCNILNDLIKMKSTHEFWKEENIVTNLTIQCLIAMCQSQFEEISHENEVVCDVVEHIKQDINKYNGNLVVEAYIYTLVIIWLNLFPSLQCQNDELFLKCLDFLFGAFELPAADGLVLSSKYQHCWVEVFPLWQVILCEVVKHCSKSVQRRHLYQSSRWHSIVPDLLNTTKTSLDFGDLTGFLELT